MEVEQYGGEIPENNGQVLIGHSIQNISNGSEPIIEDEALMIYVQVSVAFSLQLAGTLANALSLVALFNITERFNTLHYWLISLAASDLWVAVLGAVGSGLFIQEWTKTPQTRAGSTLCISIVFSEAGYEAQLLPLLVTAGIILDQYIAVSKPFSYSAIVTRKSIVIYSIAATVFTTVIYVLILVFFFSDICSEGDDKTRFVVFSAWLYTIMFTILTVISLVTYAKLYSTTQHLLKVSAVPRSANAPRPDKKLTVTLAILLGCIIVFWLPGIAGQLFSLIGSQFETRSRAGYIAYVICNILFNANLICDPLIYGARLPNVQEGYRIVWRKIITKCGFGSPSRGNWDRNLSLQNDTTKRDDF